MVKKPIHIKKTTEEGGFLVEEKYPQFYELIRSNLDPAKSFTISD
jgi:hypothetical protein